MEGPVESEAGVGKEQFLLMLYVMPVLLIAWVVSSFGVKSMLVFAGLLGYLYWINKQLWATERRRIQFEEKKKINAKRAMNEGETLRWLNEGLKAMWPICMEKFASQHFFKPMAPWFLNKYKPKFVKEVTLLGLHLGGRPPEFSLIRVLPASQDGDDVVFLAAMEFSSDKDMNAQMAVQMKAFKTTFYISKLYMKGTVKFSVKFVKGWPVLGRVRFSFETTPTVDMIARPYNKNGIDMRIIPGAANWLEETLGTALEQSVVEPYMLVIDMEKLVSNTLFPVSKLPQGLEDFFCVEHKSGFSPTVVVEILEAGELKAANGAGPPDPSVEVTLGAHKEKTKSIMKSTNPTWANEVQRIPIVNWELPNLLTMRVISKSKNYMGRQIELGICSISVKEYRDGSRHLEKLPLTIRNVPTGWLRFAITVDHQNNHSAQVVEKTHSSVGSQPTTQDIQTVSPPDSASTRNGSTNHTRNNSTEDAGLVQPVPHESGELDDGGTSEVIKMPYGGDGAFSIQCPGKEETLKFPDPVSTNTRKVKGASDSKDKDTDSKVKRSMMNILGRKKRSLSKVSNDISPSEREMTLSDQAGYSTSLDRSSELKVYHGAVRMNLQLDSPELASRDAPDVDIHCPLESLKLETVYSQEPDLTQTPNNSTGKSNQLESTIETESVTKPQPQVVETGCGNSSFRSSFSSVRDELKLSNNSQRQLPKLPEKQNSKNSWWKNLTKVRPKRRKGRGSKPDDVPNDTVFQPGNYDSFDMSDTSASQSFRKEPDENTLKMLGLHHDNASILANGRSQSCRQDPSNVKKIILCSDRAQSLRFDPSSQFLNTIHEKQQVLDRPQHD
ncbi:hypothetical protein KC19_3G105100 [Ceratodon purpureus]|uniref:C2 domain-containing protein n=1 Tax=Ceratodon purpureus TaxID=3225 RepID=A0A8T0IH32_CERPU|nr:hypothetical protein KC19_3G105100 [Ceratodon purpureus]